MIDRDHLTEALDVWRYDETGVVREAARLLLDFPTDEMRRVAWAEMKMGNGPEAVLEAVRQVMFGETT